ncbi:MAG: hypothetical protein DMG85_17675 [Acidobacteria bacterium]|nr:MAG: hypothetical protein DMG85_17675 [Acidobacteriota bacterium]
MCVEELSKFLGVANSWIYDRTRVNSPDPIPHMKLGKYIRFDVGEVQAWLNDRRSESASQSVIVGYTPNGQP